eukprot:Gb_38454 [translate_table: standard]
MPVGDSPSSPILMTPLQVIRPHPLIHVGMDSSPRGGKTYPISGESTSNKIITGIQESDTQGPRENNKKIIQELMIRLELVESSNQTLQTEVRELTTRVAEIELENISLKKLFNENKAQETHHPPNDALHVKILDLKNKKEEIKSQQATFKQETKTHINSWVQVVRGKDKAPPPMAAVEEVV